MAKILARNFSIEKMNMCITSEDTTCTQADEKQSAKSVCVYKKFIVANINEQPSAYQL